jgi:hypothetical protein
MVENQRTDDQPNVLRDYEYLDTDRLSDYLSTIDPGIFDEVRQVTRAEEGTGGDSLKVSAIGFGSIDWAGGGYTEDENTLERTVKIEAKHSFNRLYHRLLQQDSIKPISEDTYLTSERFNALRFRETVEITRYFTPMSSQFIDSIFDVLAKTTVTDAQEIRKIIEDNEAEELIPLISPPSMEGDASVITLLNPRFVIGSTKDLEGRLAVFGKVKEKIAEGPAVDVLKLLIGWSQEELRGLPNVSEDWPERKPEAEELAQYAKDPGLLERLFGSEEEERRAHAKAIEERARVKKALDNVLQTTTKVQSPVVIITPLAAYS